MPALPLTRSMASWNVRIFSPLNFGSKYDAAVEALDLGEREVGHVPAGQVAPLPFQRARPVREQFLDVRRPFQGQVVQAHQLAVLRDLQVLLDVVGALGHRQLVGGSGVFRRVGRRSPVGDVGLRSLVTLERRLSPGRADRQRHQRNHHQHSVQSRCHLRLRVNRGVSAEGRIIRHDRRPDGDGVPFTARPRTKLDTSTAGCWNTRAWRRVASMARQSVCRPLGRLRSCDGFQRFGRTHEVFGQRSGVSRPLVAHRVAGVRPVRYRHHRRNGPGQLGRRRSLAPP